MTEKVDQNALYYDGDCPFCARYSELMLARDKLGNFNIVNLRDDPESAQSFRDMGLDLEQGFVFQYEGQIYHGAEAIQKLTQTIQRTDLFSRLNRWLFRSPFWANLFYPLLKAGRSIALLLLKGRQRSKL